MGAALGMFNLVVFFFLKKSYFLVNIFIIFTFFLSFFLLEGDGKWIEGIKNEFENIKIKYVIRETTRTN
jgi:hypothetical protein